MGHIVNPISYRLYTIRYWNNNWFVSSKINYPYIFNQDVLLQKFFRKIFVLLNSVKAGVVFVNLKVIRSFNSLSFYVYVHDGFSDLLFFDLRRHYRFSLIRKFLKRFFAGRYNGCKRSRQLHYLAKKITRRYPRKFFFLFLKNRILRLY
jgi:hypothetical protein